MAFGTLVIQAPDGSSTEVELVKRQVVVGRSGDVDIPVNDSQISRRHLTILCEDAGVRLVDVGSANGTFLGTERLSPNQPVPVTDGMTFRIGQSMVTYHRPLEGSVATPPAKEEKAIEAPERVIETDTKPKTPKAPDFTPPPGAPPPGGEGQASPVLPISNLAIDARSTYLKYLPAIYATDDFIGRYLLIFESILGPIERTIGQLDMYFDPHTAPADFLPWLASWMGLVLDERWTEEQRRALILSAADLYEKRGTKRGLSEFIRLYTGYTPEIVEPGLGKKGMKPEDAFHFIVKVKAKEPARVDQTMIKSIIEMEKPAHTVYTLEISPEKG